MENKDKLENKAVGIPQAGPKKEPKDDAWQKPKPMKGTPKEEAMKAPPGNTGFSS